jgi:hypothetical protein
MEEEPHKPHKEFASPIVARFKNGRLPHGLERFHHSGIDADAFRFLNRIGAGEWDSAETFAA